LALMVACLMLVSVNGMLERRYGALVGGLSCAGVFLARLDSVFLLATWGCWYLVTVRRVGRMVQMTAVFMVVVLPYLLFNLVHFGGLMPVSGWMKTSFPHVCLKGFDLSQGVYASTFGGYRIVWGLVPILAGLTVLVIRWRNGRQVHGLLMVLLCGSILHFAYIALFVRSHTMWAWYYVVPATLMGLSAAVLLADRPALHSGLTLMVLLAGVVVVAKAARSSTKEEALWPPQAESLRFAAAHHLSNRVILVSDWPGCLAFYTDNRVVAADLITANRPLYETIRRSPNVLGGLLERCALAGAPVEYLITMGNSWLVPDPDRRGLVYNDPRTYPRPLSIGHITMPRDPIEVAWGGGFLAWEVRAGAAPDGGIQGSQPTAGGGRHSSAGSSVGGLE
jgi:hypothetical protein